MDREENKKNPVANSKGRHYSVPVDPSCTEQRQPLEKMEMW